MGANQYSFSVLSQVHIVKSLCLLRLQPQVSFGAVSSQNRNSTLGYVPSALMRHIASVSGEVVFGPSMQNLEHSVQSCRNTLPLVLHQPPFPTIFWMIFMQRFHFQKPPVQFQCQTKGSILPSHVKRCNTQQILKAISAS